MMVRRAVWRVGRLGISLMLPLAVLLVFLSAAGCSPRAKTPPGTPAAEGTCTGCHTSEERLKADLAARPLPQQEKSEETAGEG